MTNVDALPGETSVATEVWRADVFRPPQSRRSFYSIGSVISR